MDDFIGSRESRDSMTDQMKVADMKKTLAEHRRMSLLSEKRPRFLSVAAHEGGAGIEPHERRHKSMFYDQRARGLSVGPDHKLGALFSIQQAAETLAAEADDTPLYEPLDEASRQFSSSTKRFSLDESENRFVEVERWEEKGQQLLPLPMCSWVRVRRFYPEGRVKKLWDTALHVVTIIAVIRFAIAILIVVPISITIHITADDDDDDDDDGTAVAGVGAVSIMIVISTIDVFDIIIIITIGVIVILIIFGWHWVP